MMHVVSVGARAPLGLTSRQIAMCVRARKLEPRTIRLDDKRGRHIGVCATGGLADTLVGYPRWVSLAAPALAEAVRGVPQLESPAVVLVLPEPGRADDDARIAESLFDDLALRSGVAIDPERRALVRVGQAGFGRALDVAKTWLDDGSARVIVGGVDSYYHPEVLRSLDAGHRLHALDAEDGFIPSEGAAFLVLARKKSAADLGSMPLWINAEEHDAAGEAMTDMLIAANDALGPARWVVHDVNGESHRVDEWDLVALRTLPDEAVQSRWARELGDVGAASGPLFSALALRLCEARGAPLVTPGGDRATGALVALHSEGAERVLIALRGADHV